MELLWSGVVAGVIAGILYGLLAFAIVWLYKSTGVVNFAQGALATLAGFLVWQGASSTGQVWVAVLAAVVGMSVVCAVIYLLIVRPRPGEHVNMIMRTLGVYLLLHAVINLWWGAGQPFTFPRLVPQGRAMTVLGVSLSWVSVATLVAAALLVAGFGLMFRRTRTGLLFLGLAERPDIARLLGVRVHRLSLLAWVIAGLIALAVGILLAPRALLTTDMTDPYLLLAFTAAIVGGLDSLLGALVGGVVVGVTTSVTTIYISSDMAMIVVFALFLVFLTARPQGFFGSSVRERL